MQPEYLARLSPDLQAMVGEIEAAIETEILVVVDPERAAHIRPDGRHILACKVNQDGALLLTPSADYFPNGGVFHELLHVKRFLVDGVPQLGDNPASEHWNLELDEGLHKLDLSLEHFFIVPQELGRYPDRSAHWELSLEHSWQRGVFELENERERWAWALVHAVFVRLVFPQSRARRLSDGVIANLGMADVVQRLHQAVLPALATKEELARVCLAHLGAPRDLVVFRYLDSRGRCVRETPAFLPD